jgi:hypothetical protein
LIEKLIISLSIMLEFVKKRCVYAYVAILKAEHGLDGFRDYTDFWGNSKMAVTPCVTAILKKICEIQ